MVPAFVSLLCICIAFVPMFFLPGISGYLFAPMAEAVLFALVGSFILSRTLVPTMASYFLVAHGDSKDTSVARSHDAGGATIHAIRWCASSTVSSCGLRKFAPAISAI